MLRETKFAPKLGIEPGEPPPDSFGEAGDLCVLDSMHFYFSQWPRWVNKNCRALSSFG